MKDFIQIKTFTTRLEAEIAKGFLTSHGIESIVTADDEGGAYPFPFQPTTAGVGLFVEEKHVKTAKKLLEKKKK